MRANRGGQLADRIGGASLLVLLDDQRQIDQDGHRFVSKILQNLDGQCVRLDRPLHCVQLIVGCVVEPVAKFARLQTICEAGLSCPVEVKVLAFGHQSCDALHALRPKKEETQRERE